MVGNLTVTVTPSLRELFSRTHDVMSGDKPIDQQFRHDEQHEMFVACQIAPTGKKGKIDGRSTEDNLLELIDFLYKNGVPVLGIIGEIRCFSNRTRGMAIRLHCEEFRQHKAEAEAAMSKPVPRVLFAAPSFAEARA